MFLLVQNNGSMRANADQTADLPILTPFQSVYTMVRGSLRVNKKGGRLSPSPVVVAVKFSYGQGELLFA